jgi:hypothetical protein
MNQHKNLVASLRKSTLFNRQKEMTQFDHLLSV